MKIKVQIFAGSGPAFGTGHRARMSELHDRLRASGAACELFYLRGSPSAPSDLEVFSPTNNAQESLKSRLADSGRRVPPASVLVLDARDVNPELFLPCSIIALDNRCANREELLQTTGVIFHDTLPHPEADLARVLEHCLLSRDLIEVAQADTVGLPTRRALVYVGSSGIERRLDPILRDLILKGEFTEVLRVGGTTPEIPDIRHAARLEGPDYARALRESETVFSYFGLTILEAWHVGSRPIMFSIGSAVHDELSRDLSRRTGMPFIESHESEAWRSAIRGRVTLEARPGGRGFEILEQRIRELYEAS